MRNIEARGKIKDIKGARDTAEKIGAIFKGYYHAIDIILKPKNEEPEKGIIDLRIFDINNRATKSYIVTQKIAIWSDKTKKDKVVVKKYFDTLGEMTNFIIERYGYIFNDRCEYSREGWEYHMEKGDIFIEYIERLGPTIEIEADNKENLEELFQLFDISERFSESTPEIMRRLISRYSQQ